MRFAYAFAAVSLCVWFSIGARPIHAAVSPHPFPRLANLYLPWHLSAAEARDLARWDVIILDMEVAENTPEAFAALRAANPNAVLLAYVTSQEIRQDASVHPQTPKRRKLAARIADAWYLHDLSGARTSWWPQTWLLNVSSSAPVVAGQRWTDALAEFVATEIASDPRWDGVYFDNLWNGISWFNRAAIDLNGDGRPEDPATRDAAWVEGTRALLAATRARVPSTFLITGNGSARYADDTNGLLLEHFPNTTEGSWSASMTAYRTILSRATSPVVAMLNANTANTGTWQHWSAMRFGLASALLGDGYFSFDFGDQEHAQRWWYDEYDTFLGAPKGDPQRIVRTADAARGVSVPSPSATENSSFPLGVYRRDFAQGLVLVNGTAETTRLQFDEEFEHLLGAQDATTNSGAITSEITLPPHDGVILLRPIASMREAVFANGAFARIFRSDGTVARNGFFAYDTNVRGSAQVEYRDLDRDEHDETIIADRGRITVRDPNGATRITFAPFGDAFTGALDFAIGDLDRNGTWEIVVVPKSHGGQLGTFNLLEGRQLYPYRTPFGSGWMNGMSVALRTPSRDARPEIVVGAGTGTRPTVRVLAADGMRERRAFTAFDARFRGGVNVAAGDLDGDGSDEIVVGAGSGGGPHVRVFTGSRGDVMREFFAFAPERRGGVDVAIADVDGDGRGEIIGLSTRAFTAAAE